MVLPRLNRAAHGKSYMGYSDAGTLLAALYAGGIGRQFHGPMPVDIVRAGGEAAVVRELRWLVAQVDESVDTSVRATAKTDTATNPPLFSTLKGTTWQAHPTGDGRVDRREG